MPSKTLVKLLSSCALLLASAPAAWAQVYGYTNENGILILSNVPAHDRMRLIADGTPEEAGKTWKYSGQYDDLIMKASQLYGVDSALVRAVIAVESAFNRYARSPVGARGLMQLMPDTGRMYGVGNAYDPWQNIRAGTAYLKEQMTTFRDLRLALAAYNAGPNAVKRYNGIPPYPETQNYVKKVTAIYKAGSKIQIVKGGKVYSIGQPGGSTRVTQFHRSGNSSLAQQSASSSTAEPVRNGRESTIGAAARRANAESAPAPREESPTRLVYYRYVDPNGIVHIARTAPDGLPHVVLEP